MVVQNPGEWSSATKSRPEAGAWPELGCTGASGPAFTRSLPAFTRSLDLWTAILPHTSIVSIGMPSITAATLK
jgi:hypothetical protein